MLSAGAWSQAEVVLCWVGGNPPTATISLWHAKRQQVKKKGPSLCIDVNFGRTQPTFLHKCWPFVISKALNGDWPAIVERAAAKMICDPKYRIDLIRTQTQDIDWAVPGCSLPI